eukprot:6592312-Karenia_brevis.AAC.1
MGSMLRMYHVGVTWLKVQKYCTSAGPEVQGPGPDPIGLLIILSPDRLIQYGRSRGWDPRRSTPIT